MEDQLGVDRNSKTKKEDGSDLGKTRPQVTSVGDRLASTGGVVQLILQTLGSGPTTPVVPLGVVMHNASGGRGLERAHVCRLVSEA